MKRKLTVITCPECGREYLPEEIIVPTGFFGKPDIIQRDVNGCITNFSGSTIDPEELYCCDNCNTSFRVVAKINFETEVDERSNFNAEYKSSLQPRFNLKEF